MCERNKFRCSFISINFYYNLQIIINAENTSLKSTEWELRLYLHSGRTEYSILIITNDSNHKW